MMSRQLRLFWILVITSGSLVLDTKAAPSAAPVVAVVSMEEVMQLSEAGGKEHQALTKLQTDKMTQIQNKQKDFDKKAKSLEARAKTVDTVLIVKEQEDLLAERQAIEAFIKSAEGELQRAISRAMGQIGEWVREAVKDLAATKGWDIVFLKETGQIIYYSDKADISKIVAGKVDELNKQQANAKPSLPKQKPNAGKSNLAAAAA